ncbi:hypothetical protein SFH28_002960 [Streptococcus anginosus]|uniref:Uncharacterized protein n=1 Tax=Streptococcus anginosus TaxID=1328 RepID=A0ACC7PNE2_STRAP|nr:hypothetical protein [Streptococcus anginosus]
MLVYLLCLFLLGVAFVIAALLFKTKRIWYYTLLILGILLMCLPLVACCYSLWILITA